MKASNDATEAINADVTVVGSGLLRLAAAYESRRRDLRVPVSDSTISPGATMRNRAHPRKPGCATLMERK
jgi:ribulose 1,5-bisphosphate synthetase/thiazole synthase